MWGNSLLYLLRGLGRSALSPTHLTSVSSLPPHLPIPPQASTSTFHSPPSTSVVQLPLPTSILSHSPFHTSGSLAFIPPRIYCLLPAPRGHIVCHPRKEQSATGPVEEPPQWVAGVTVSLQAHSIPAPASFSVMFLTIPTGMFEGDQDLDLAGDIGFELTGKNPTKELAWVDYFTTGHTDPEFPAVDAEVVREKLDSGIGDHLFQKFRAKETADRQGEYRVIILTAMMMRVGATIKQDVLQHVRALAPRIPSREGYALPLFDEGFRGPGKRQFLTALESYQAGTPRSFEELSCYGCGKIGADIGKALSLCGGCKNAWYCNKVRLARQGSLDVARHRLFDHAQDCQRSNWNDHKKTCPPHNSMWLNV